VIRIVANESEASVPEYEPLVFEHLVMDVARKWPSAAIIRGRWRSADCTAETISVTMEGVAKGNAMVRTLCR
jgi:hypothetical protein